MNVRILDVEGRPIKYVAVEYEMLRHAFPFGTCIRADRLAETLPDPDHPYHKNILKLFNRGTLGNYYKWRFQEEPDRRALADAATQWMLKNGLSIHAHVMIWATFKYGAMPKDVKEKLQNNAPDAAEYAVRRSLEHIETVGRRYRGLVDEWDVVNEHFSEHEITKIANPDVPKEKAPLLLKWFEAARGADPVSRLYINDFGILVGDQKKHKDSYEETIRFLLDNNAPLGGIGMQAHYTNGWQRRTPLQLRETLDRFGRYDIPIQITEFDMWGKGWGDTKEARDQAQAEYLEQFYTVAFSHPAVNGITMWGFWDGQHWTGNAPLFNKDWSPKPALEVYKRLVFQEWWTKGQTRTDHKGRFQARGYYGDYIFRIKEGQKIFEAAASFQEESEEIIVTVKK
ncbi:MAG: endo-1,4-beta-xylanase [Candidatus Sumerlaeia bacterium]